ncbi:MAG: formylglycine-generating enzyme family protein [Candidatus Marinimicrobia bacterium]|nr:formylglycine-generating enzyme family protein [Candidatus Neomarinimicrobiota bacterium]
MEKFRSSFLTTVILFVILLLNTGCELLNTPPVVDKISAQPDRINTYDMSTLICVASDADDDKLSYSWSSIDGAFIGGSKSDSVIWQAPNVPGRYSVEVTVSDDYDFVKESVIIVVVESFNFITVPSGYFSYGEGDTPNHISYSFEIMKYEVTNAQYTKYLEEAISVGEITVSSDVVSGYYTGDANNTAGTYTLLDMQTDECKINYLIGEFIVDDGFDNHPVVMVTWFGAYLFAAHYGLNLPDEYEWEMAARGNTGYDFPWGNENPTCEQANHYGCLDVTQAVGISAGKSVFGVYDMAGNVWEWTDSYYDTTVTNRVRRGGAFNNDAGHLYSWYRYHTAPTGTYPAIGFRCIRKN